MKHRYIVAYDVSDPKRLRQVHKKMKGYGDALQYSVFQCDLSDVQKLRMVEALTELINHVEDRVLIVDVGPAVGRARVAYEYIGRQVVPGAAGEDAALIV